MEDGAGWDGNRIGRSEVHNAYRTCRLAAGCSKLVPVLPVRRAQVLEIRVAVNENLLGMPERADKLDGVDRVLEAQRVEVCDITRNSMASTTLPIP